MKNKMWIFLVVFFLVLSGTAVALNIPNYKGYVNDFAGMLGSEQAAQLEQKLGQYDKQTSNQIAILTINSLEGSDIESYSIQVASEWKIGQKGKDNGVLVTIAKKDHRMRIEVGYGLEGDLTDLMAGRIVDEIMTPAFKAGDFYGGINKAVDNIIEKLGQYTVQERAIMAQNRAEEKRIAEEKANEIGIGILIFIVAAIGLIGMVFFIRMIMMKIRESLRKKSLRKSLRVRIADLEEEFSDMEKFMPESTKNSVTLPIWAEDKFNSLLGQLEYSISVGYSGINNAKLIIDDDPDKAVRKLNDVENTKRQALKKMTEMESLPQEVTTVRTTAEPAVKSLEKLLTETSTNVERLEQGGIVADISSAQLAALKSKTAALQERLKKSGIGRNDFSRDIFQEASNLQKEINILSQSVASLQGQKEKVSAFVTKTSGDVEVLKAGIAQRREMLKDIQKNNPETVWHDVAGRYAGADKLIASISGVIAAVAASNLSKESGINSAVGKISEAGRIRQQVVSLQEDVSELAKKIETAKSEVARILPTAIREVKLAESNVRKSDVESKAKSLAQQATTGLHELRQKIDQSMADWIGLAILAQSVISIAGDATRRAKSDIGDAETARERSSQSSSSSSGSSSTGDSFGGFGGGSFGGGGASGSW